MTTLSLKRIDIREIRLPLRSPFRISSGVVSERRICLLEVHTSEGAIEWAECVAGESPNYSPETIDTAWIAIREWIAPRCLGRTFGGPEDVYPVLQRDFRGHNMAKAAVEMGIWGAAARLDGVSLADRIGGTRDRVATGISLGIQESREHLVEQARAALDAGYRKVKIKIAPGRDVEWVGAVREAVGPDTELMADANSAYTLDDADHLAALDEFDLMMIEQPLAHDDLVRHAELQRRLRTPLCMDESVTSVDRAEDMVHLGSGRIINIKPGRVGGFTASLAIHDFAVQHGVPVWCGGMLESGVGRAYNVALASLPGFTLPGDLSPSARYWARDVVLPEWTMDSAGTVRVPRDEPGIGVEVDIDLIEDLTVRLERLEARA